MAWDGVLAGWREREGGVPIARYLTNFAKTGDPIEASLSTWPRFELQRLSQLHLATPITVQHFTTSPGIRAFNEVCDQMKRAR